MPVPPRSRSPDDLLHNISAVTAGRALQQVADCCAYLRPGIIFTTEIGTKLVWHDSTYIAEGRLRQMTPSTSGTKRPCICGRS